MTTDSFDAWLFTRQDARQWSEDEKACAEIAWKEAWRISSEARKKEADRLWAQIKVLEQKAIFIEGLKK